ncbi:unnamed protein product [Miscanthus lutarioriparius]|uniref:Uncharacterized protein n=1 Tax=Miscanthus lutarioriparius TaxID=422564 RepID=A0A811PKD0_9POAL|nr:unnamed protein product [Miscanthus lutarioriparius]
MKGATKGATDVLNFPGGGGATAGGTMTSSGSSSSTSAPVATGGGASRGGPGISGGASCSERTRLRGSGSGGFQMVNAKRRNLGAQDQVACRLRRLLEPRESGDLIPDGVGWVGRKGGCVSGRTAGSAPATD